MTWTKGQSGNPSGGGRAKPFRDALRMEAIELANGVQLEHPPGSLRWNAQQLLLSGEVPSIKEIADRLDGKPVQPIAGSDDDPPIGIPMQSDSTPPASQMNKSLGLERFLQGLSPSAMVQALDREMVRRSLTEWCRRCGYVPAKHHRLIINKLERVARGEIDRLSLFMPPGSAKSTYATILYPGGLSR